LYLEYHPAESTTNQTLVFIHGWGMHSGIWAQIWPAFQSAVNCILIDLPGMGRSPLAKGNYTLEFVVEQLQQVLKPYQHHILHWVGWSLGAFVAAKLCANFSKSASFTSIAMAERFVAPDTAISGINQAALRRFKVLLDEDLEGTLYRFLSLNVKGSPQHKAELRILQQLVFSYGFPAKKALLGGLEILEQASLSQFLSKLPCPACFIFGEQDALLETDISDLMRTRWAAPSLESQSLIKVKLMANAGHIPFLSDPAHFNNLLRQNIIEVTRRS